MVRAFHPLHMFHGCPQRPPRAQSPRYAGFLSSKTSSNIAAAKGAREAVVFVPTSGAIRTSSRLYLSFDKLGEGHQFGNRVFQPYTYQSIAHGFGYQPLRPLGVRPPWIWRFHPACARRHNKASPHGPHHPANLRLFLSSVYLLCPFSNCGNRV